MNSPTELTIQNTPLEEYLGKFSQYMEDGSVTEVCFNSSNEIFTLSDRWQSHASEITDRHCIHLAKLIASTTGQRFSTKDPIMSATLPDGSRVQCVHGSALFRSGISITIRKHSKQVFSLDDYVAQGAFDSVNTGYKSKDDAESTLLGLLEQGQYTEFLKTAVLRRKNIIVSGSTGSGKTTLMKSMLQHVPDNERLVTIENVDELGLYKTHPNVVPMRYSAGNQGMADIDQQQLLESSLRMNPDRIFLAELIRGDEAFYYLRNVNSGHPGSITSMHANSAKLAIEQLVLFLKESNAGKTLTRNDIKSILAMCVDVIVQINVVNGKRMITEIHYDPESQRKQLES